MGQKRPLCELAVYVHHIHVGESSAKVQ